jgi:hypothetical protein
MVGILFGAKRRQMARAEASDGWARDGPKQASGGLVELVFDQIVVLVE